MDNKITYNPLSRWRFKLKKAKGSIIWTSDNKRLIDFTSGWNVANLGWNNPEIKEAIIKQARINQYSPMWSSEESQEHLSQELIKSLPKELNTIIRATGGTEANEEAIKLARVYTGRKTILGFKKTYHGQSLGTLSIGFPKRILNAIAPNVGNFIQLDFPDVKNSDKSILKKFALNLKTALSKSKVAAVVCEAGIVTGWGDTRIAVPSFLSEIRKLTKSYKTLMILDEVGTGFSRCGHLFAMNAEGVVPDIVTFAKALSNGSSAIGCAVTSREISQLASSKSILTSTFGWTPIACAASFTTLRIHKRERLWEKAAIDGKYIVEALSRSFEKESRVERVNGIGMIIGVTLENKLLTEKVVSECFEHGLHIVSDGNKNIQIMPPLVINRRELDQGLEILVETIRKC